MENEDEFLHTYFTHVSQLCFDRAKEHIEKEKEPKSNATPWTNFLNLLQQLALAEKNYIEIGFLQNKQKSFLRKDNSLKSVYEGMKNELKRIEETCKTANDKRVQNYCQNIVQFISARISLIELYEKIYAMGSLKQLKYNDMLHQIESLIQKNALGFTDISLTPAKAVFSLECEILEQLFRALTELQRLQFLPSLACVHGAHTRLLAWETKMQCRETWKLNIVFKNNPLPSLFQWLQKLKGAILSKFSLYFHGTLAQQTTPSDMKQLCSKLQHDHYQKMVNFQKKYFAAYVILLSDNSVQCDTTDYDSFPIIVSYPPKSPPQLESILKIISETANDLILDKIIYKFSSQTQCTYVLTTVEPNIYMVILFENKKSDKDSYIANFVTDLCTNLRCTKVFLSLKDTKNK